MKHYDVIVIGAGGGTKLVSPVANLGLKVALLEKESPGGTCLNRGCIPSKMLIHPADIIQHLRDAYKFELGLKASIDIDFESLVSRISDTVDKESASIPTAYQKNPNIDYYPYEGRFVSNKTLEVNGEKITADKIFIASGSRPHIPEISGLSDTPFMTSRECLRNTQLPVSMIIIGASYIACELGHAYGSFGCKTEYIVRSKLLRHEDEDISAEFSKEFGKAHHLHLGYSPLSVKYEGDEFLLECKHQSGTRKTIRAKALLVATGTIPNSDNLGLENTDIKTSEKGFICVNQYLETSVDSVYALGDVVGNYFFRHSVNYEGEYLFKALFKDNGHKPLVYPPMPHAVFTYPQIAGVGKTESQLIAEGAAYVSGKAAYRKSAMGMARLSDHGFVKVLIDKHSKKLLGAHIIGDEASNMIHVFIAFMSLNADLDQMLDMIYVHPALNEIARNALRNARSLLQ